MTYNSKWRQRKDGSDAFWYFYWGKHCFESYSPAARVYTDIISGYTHNRERQFTMRALSSLNISSCANASTLLTYPREIFSETMYLKKSTGYETQRTWHFDVEILSFLTWILSDYICNQRNNNRWSSVWRLRERVRIKRKPRYKNTIIAVYKRFKEKVKKDQIDYLLYNPCSWFKKIKKYIYCFVKIFFQIFLREFLYNKLYFVINIFYIVM